MRGTFHQLETGILPTGRATVQTMGAIVLWQLIGLAVQGETPIAYTVGITSNEGAKVGEMILRKIVVEIVEPKHYIT